MLGRRVRFAKSFSYVLKLVIMRNRFTRFCCVVSKSHNQTYAFLLETNEFESTYLHGRVPSRVAIKAWESGKSSRAGIMWS